MGNRNEHIERLTVKLKVLESKIRNLESITDEVVNEVNTEFQQQLKELQLKKEAAQQKLSEMKGLSKIE